MRCLPSCIFLLQILLILVCSVLEKMHDLRIFPNARPQLAQKNVSSLMLAFCHPNNNRAKREICLFFNSCQSQHKKGQFWP